MLNPDVFQHMSQLPTHKNLCHSLLNLFFNDNRIDGAFISGSGASGNMDLYSDLDLGFVCSSESTKEEIWQNRFSWNLPAWFHRMDADHIKPYFIIYLFEPHIHVDLALYTMVDLPHNTAGPVTLAFDKKAQLARWNSETNKPQISNPDWSKVVHEEEQFWTWIHYSWCHSGRGEYYDDASTFHLMRDIVQSWHARLNGKEKFDTRRLEQRGENAFIDSMRFCFPTPDRASMKTALLNLIDIHNKQREQLDQLVRPKWKTTQDARNKISQLVQNL